MRVTISQLRKIIQEELDPASSEDPDTWTFAATAEEEAHKVNDQTQSPLKLVTDQKFWEDQGVVTGEDLARTILASSYSDSYKELNGIRPRWIKFSEMSPREIQKMLTNLNAEAERKDAEDEKWDRERADIEASAAAAAAAEAEEEAMKIPEPGEEFPSLQGMGRRPRKMRESGANISRESLRAMIIEIMGEI